MKVAEMSMLIWKHTGRIRLGTRIYGQGGSDLHRKQDDGSEVEKVRAYEEKKHGYQVRRYKRLAVIGLRRRRSNQTRIGDR